MKKYLKVDLKKYRKIIFLLLVGLFLSVAANLIYSRYTQVLPQSAIYFLNEAVLPNAGQKVLVFSPHPDDESIAVGGYIYDSEKKGAQVKIILVTDGNKHHLKEKRYGEFRKATGDLGVKPEDLVFLNYPDGRLKQSVSEQKIAKEFQNNIELFKPDIIIYPSPSDTHPDHAYTGTVLKTVLADDKFDKISYQYLVHHNHFPQPKKYSPDLYLLPPLSLISFDNEWKRHMLSIETERKKNEAVDVYQSQLKTPILRSVILSSIRKNELLGTNTGGN